MDSSVRRRRHVSSGAPRPQGTGESDGSRTRGGVVGSEDDVEALEAHLHRLTLTRTHKNARWAERQAALIERDAAREAAFLAEFPPPAVVAAARRAEARAALIAASEALAEEEWGGRELLEEEETLEFRVHEHTLHLDVLCVAVAGVMTEWERRQQNQAALQHHLACLAVEFGRRREALVQAVEGEKRGVGRNERVEREAIAAAEAEGRNAAAMKASARLRRELEAAAEEEARLLWEEEQQKLQEVADVEAEWNEKLDRLSRRWETMAKSAT